METPWVDLTALMTRLCADRRYKALGALVHRLWSLHGAVADIHFARRALDQLSALGPVLQQGPDDPMVSVMADSLMTSAVIAYCRAVHSRPVRDGRHHVLGTAGLSPEARAQHKLITDLRDKVVAHHGYGDFHPETPWLRDRLVARIRGEVGSVRGPFVRLNTSVATMAALDALTHAAVARYEQLAPPLREDLLVQFRDLLEQDAHFHDLCLKHCFDGAAFHGLQPGWNAESNDFAFALDEHQFWFGGLST